MIPDRAAAFAALIERYRDVPFQWGVQDCCLWAATAVHALRGYDPAEEWRGTYDTKKGARALLRDRFDNHACNIPGEVGLVEVPVKKAQRGYIVTMYQKPWWVLGVCAGQKAAFASPKGLVFFPMSVCRRAWAV